MTRARSVLLIVVAGELVVGGVLLSRRPPAAPSKGALVPDTPEYAAAAEELHELRRRADRGGAAEWRALGEGLLGQGVYARAEHAFRAAVERDPTDHEARIGLAFVLDRMGRFDESLPEWTAAVEHAAHSEDDARRARYAIGMTHLRLGEPERAEAVFRANSGHPPSSYQLAKLLVRSGQAEEGLSIVEGHLRFRPGDIVFDALHVRALEALGRNDAARRAADELEYAELRTHLSPGTDFVRRFRDRHGLERLKKEYNELVSGQDPDVLDAKLDEMDAAIGGRMVPAVVSNAVSRAEVAYLRGDRPGLRASLDRLNELGVVSSDAFVLRGTLLRESKDPAAVTVWERVLRLGPNAIAHRALAEHYDAAGNEAERDRHLAGWRLVEGIGHARQGRLDAARTELEEAVRLDPTNARAWCHLGETRHRLGEPTEARAAWERASELDPSHGRSRRSLARLGDEGTE